MQGQEPLQESNIVMTASPVISICICTYLRPEGLRKLLGGIADLDVSFVSRYEIEVIVVDNDVNETAKQVVDLATLPSGWAKLYRVEPRRGIPQARNKAIRSISERSEFVIFIDDDEIPGRQWLNELMRTQMAYNADIVCGPVVSIFDRSIPQWIIEGDFFKTIKFQTGQRIPSAGSGNMLITGATLASQPPFDESLALTGGSDILFFQRARKSGTSIVWSEEAIAYEDVPASRGTAKWILLRALRNSMTTARFEIMERNTLSVRIARGLKGVGKVCTGTAKIVILISAGKIGLLMALKDITRGVGYLVGAMNMSYEEYRKVHGS